MDRYLIEKNGPLNGEVLIGGAKNSVLGLMAASILCKGTTIINNVPMVNDVINLIELMKSIGSEIKINNHQLVINNKNIDPSIVLDYEKTKELRASYYLLGSLIGRFHYACVSMPGGCNIGSRPIDLHLKGFKLLGVNINLDDGNIKAEATKLAGQKVYLDFASVGATINIMLSAVLADGTTIIINAAKEPHVIDVANMLNKMGADIKYAGTDTIVIKGVKELKEIEYTTIPDQIEAGTFLIAGAITKGNVTIKNIIPEHMNCITYKLKEMGCKINTYNDSINVQRTTLLNPVRISTAPYPGFPTDMQPQFAVLMGLANGVSTLEENIFENRFLYVDEMSRLGADMRVSGNTNIIFGVNKYKKATVCAPDLRAGAALVLAGLTSSLKLDNVHLIERGYEDFDKKLNNLGAKIKKI